jgi:hypothetical protein
MSTILRSVNSQKAITFSTIYSKLKLRNAWFVRRNQDGSVGIVTGYWSGGRGSILCTDKRFFSTPQRPDRLWSPPTLVSFPEGKASGSWS